MDKKLVDEVLKNMPKPTFNDVITHPGGGVPMPVFMMDQDGNRVTHEEYMAGATDPYPYPAFSFMAALRQDAPERTYKRRGTLFRGDGFAIPPFDPFHDHVTNLIVKDRRVQARLCMLDFRLDPRLIEMNMKAFDVIIGRGVSVRVIEGIDPGNDIVINKCPAFKRHIPGVSRYW